MKIKFLFLLVLPPLISNAESLEGVARNKNGEIVYTEKHSITVDPAGLNSQITVEYFKPDGNRFAAMTSDFAKNNTVPETTFEDQRFQRKSLIRLTNNIVEFEEIKDGKIISHKTFPLTPSMVAGQGFDNFIKMKADQLQKGPVDFKFGVLENKDFYSLTGYRKTSKSPDEIEYGIKASSWFLRLFAGELRVSYDSKSKKLKSFTGRSNILDDKENAQDVVITYQWKSSP